MECNIRFHFPVLFIFSTEYEKKSFYHIIEDDEVKLAVRMPINNSMENEHS